MDHHKIKKNAIANNTENHSSMKQKTSQYKNDNLVNRITPFPLDIKKKQTITKTTMTSAST